MIIEKLNSHEMVIKYTLFKKIDMRIVMRCMLNVYSLVYEKNRDYLSEYLM